MNLSEPPIDLSHGSVTDTAAVRDVLAERQRQIDRGHGQARDDQGDRPTELIEAAVSYAWPRFPDRTHIDAATIPIPVGWPWNLYSWKPKSLRSNLVRACALLLAAIESLDRAEARRSQQS